MFTAQVVVKRLTLRHSFDFVTQSDQQKSPSRVVTLNGFTEPKVDSQLSTITARQLRHSCSQVVSLVALVLARGKSRVLGKVNLAFRESGGLARLPNSHVISHPCGKHHKQFVVSTTNNWSSFDQLSCTIVTDPQFWKLLNVIGHHLEGEAKILLLRTIVI